MKGRQTMMVLTAVVALAMMITPSSLPKINGTHEPDEPYIKVTGKLLTDGKVAYKFERETDVSHAYTTDATKALQSWRTALQQGASPEAQWEFVRGEFKGVTDIVVKLVNDKEKKSFFCSRFAESGSQQNAMTMMLSALPLSLQPAFATSEEPMDSQRRSNVWVVYIGCGDQLFSHSNIQRQVAHVIGHGLGMGFAAEGAESVMCHYDGQAKCTISITPTTMDVRCVVLLYGTEGFQGKNIHQRPEFCT